MKSAVLDFQTCFFQERNDSDMSSFIFIGGDKRMLYAGEKLGKVHLCGFGKLTPCNGILEEGELFDYAVLPPQKSPDNVNIPCPFSDILVPYSALGKVLKENGTVFTGSVCGELERVCRENGFTLVNYLECEEAAVKNAVLTAQGVLPLIINELPCSVFGTEILITGFGRIASVLAGYLKALGASVTVACRRPEAAAWAQICGCRTSDITDASDFATAVSAASVIVNTVPCAVFGDEEITAMKDGTIYIELASVNGISGDVPCKIKSITARGIPGKVSPVSAGEIIADTITNLLREGKGDRR